MRGDHALTWCSSAYPFMSIGHDIPRRSYMHLHVHNQKDPHSPTSTRTTVEPWACWVHAPPTYPCQSPSPKSHRLGRSNWMFPFAKNRIFQTASICEPVAKPKQPSDRLTHTFGQVQVTPCCHIRGWLYLGKQDWTRCLAKGATDAHQDRGIIQCHAARIAGRGTTYCRQ